MQIEYLKKKYRYEKHDYFLGVRLTKEDFKDEKIKEVVLKIKIPTCFNWTASGNIQVKNEVDKEDSIEYTIFEIRIEKNLYPEDMPFEVVGPKSDIGKIEYSVSQENYLQYSKKFLHWNLYGNGVLSCKDSKPLNELQNF